MAILWYKKQRCWYFDTPQIHENFQNILFWWKGATFLNEKVIVFKEFSLLDPYHESVSTEIKSAVLLTKVQTTKFKVEV